MPYRGTVAFPERLLADDEEVVLHLHPHWKVLVGPVLVFLVTAGLGGFAAAVIDVAFVRWAILAVAIFLVLWFSVRPAIICASTHFVLTTHRVLLREGVLARSGRDVPLARINDVSFEHSLFERAVGCGTLVVESAGERGQVVLRDIPRVETVQSTLYRLVEEDHDRRGSANDGT
jgi:uncharacterized membrane protein YdbT with pleckstrin-like domain